MLYAFRALLMSIILNLYRKFTQGDKGREARFHQLPKGVKKWIFKENETKSSL